MNECPKCGAVGTIVDLGACCWVRAKIAAEGGKGGALPQDIQARETRRMLPLVNSKPFNTKGS